MGGNGATASRASFLQRAIVATGGLAAGGVVVGGLVEHAAAAPSPALTDWPAGGFIGIHGTSRPELLPGRVSHGCIRLRNEDIVELDRLMPVGTPVTIVA